MDHDSFQLFRSAIMDFHIWSQGVYPGEIASYLKSEGAEFEEFESAFEEIRSRTIDLIASKLSGDMDSYRRSYDILQLKLSSLKDILRRRTTGFDSYSLYLAFVDTSQNLLTSIEQLPSTSTSHSP